MAPEIFSAKHAVSKTGTSTASALFWRAVWRSLLGFVLLVIAKWGWEQNQSLLWATVFALPGISLLLHFGVFNFFAAFWKWMGVPTYILFPAPLASYSLSEFWGRRWNLPFTEMIQRGIYRPLTNVLGRKGAAFSGFMFSGILHECAISHSVKQGYGLPMLYFFLHGGLVFLERSTGLKTFLQTRPILARIWTLSCLALPMPILFHRPFLEGIVWPLIGVQA